MPVVKGCQVHVNPRQELSVINFMFPTLSQVAGFKDSGEDHSHKEMMPHSGWFWTFPACYQVLLLAFYALATLTQSCFVHTETCPCPVPSCASSRPSQMPLWDFLATPPPQKYQKHLTLNFHSSCQFLPHSCFFLRRYCNFKQGYIQESKHFVNQEVLSWVSVSITLK